MSFTNNIVDMLNDIDNSSTAKSKPFPGMIRIPFSKVAVNRTALDDLLNICDIQDWLQENRSKAKFEWVGELEGDMKKHLPNAIHIEPDLAIVFRLKFSV